MIDNIDDYGYFDPSIDYNRIVPILTAIQFFKIIRLGIIIWLAAYILGILWYIFTDIEFHLTPGVASFINSTGMDKKLPSVNTLTNVYFSFTTLSTVGLGDYHPISDLERLIFTFILLSGVSLFSYIMGNFVEVIEGVKLLGAQNEDADRLSKFFGLMAKYNGGRRLKKSYIEEFENYFSYYWEHDKLYFLQGTSDIRFWDELPSDIKIQIF